GIAAKQVRGVATLDGRLRRMRRCGREAGEGSDVLEKQRLVTSRAEARVAGRTASLKDSKLRF
ncbi:hypothetical protein Dimus_031612, partial [Dionaea muscipula]